MNKLINLFQTLVFTAFTVVAAFNLARSIIQGVDTILIILMMLLTILSGVLAGKSARELWEDIS